MKKPFVRRLPKERQTLSSLETTVTVLRIVMVEESDFEEVQVEIETIAVLEIAVLTDECDGAEVAAVRAVALPIEDESVEVEVTVEVAVDDDTVLDS